MPHFNVINLVHDEERRARMERQLARAPVSYEFFRGVDGDDKEGRSPFPLLPAHGRYGLPRSASEKACFASHALLWRKAVAEGVPVGIVEDDIDLAPGFGAAARLAFDNVGDGLVRLCGLENRPCVTLRSLAEGFRLVQFLKGPSGTQGYVVSPAAAAQLLALSQPIRDPVDEFVDRFWVHGVASRAIVPWQIRHIDGDSRIERAAPPTGFRKLRFKAERHLDSLRRRRWLRRNLGGHQRRERPI
jgi:glycosyl transferase family 25